LDLGQTYFTVPAGCDATATDNCTSNPVLTYVLTGATTGSGTTLTGVQLNVGANNIEWTARDLAGNSSKCSTVVTVSKRLTSLVYSGDVSEQYSDITDLRATLTDNVSGVGISGKTITFTIGTQSATATTNSSGVAATTLKLTQSPIPNYNVVTSFAGDAYYVSSSDMDGFNIQQENAIVEYTGQEFIGVQSSTATITPVLLTASINDIADGLGLDGDIRNARVQFYDINTNAAISTWLTPGLVNLSDYTKGLVTYTWNASVPNTGYNSTTVGIRVGTQVPAEDNGYYVGYGQTVINVYRVSLVEFITGGGHIIPSDSKGEYASDAGKKVNFGFNVKWNRSVTNLQGNLNLIFRRAGKVYQIKSTAMNSLSIISTNPCSQKATFVSKANLSDVTNSSLPISVYGGISLQVTMTDNGEPGRSDMIGFTLMNGNNLVYSSSWPVNKTLESFLIGGNLVVHNGVNCNVTGTSTTAVSSTKNPSIFGDVVTLKATVTGAVFVPSGSIIFKDGTTELATVSMSGGTASYTTNALTVGTHEITALYSGDTKFLSSVGTLSQKVNDPTLAIVSRSQVTPTVDAKATPITSGESLLASLSLSAFPNPSADVFNLLITGKNNSPITVRVTDMLGRVIEVQQVGAGSTIRTGQKWKGGIYFIEVLQGKERKQIRVIKAN
jgi:hypothetical protein